MRIQPLQAQGCRCMRTGTECQPRIQVHHNGFGIRWRLTNRANPQTFTETHLAKRLTPGAGPVTIFQPLNQDIGQCFRNGRLELPLYSGRILAVFEQGNNTGF